MTADLGYFTLVLAAAASLAQAGLLRVGALRGAPAWLAAGRHASVASAALVALAAACLAAAHAGGEAVLPAGYRLAAAWNAPGGAFLLWSAAIAAWGLALRLADPALPDGLRGHALALLGLVQAGCLTASAAIANPFAGSAASLPLDPVLQDPAVLLHQPLLALGAAGLAPVFVLAAAVLSSARVDPDWARIARPWTLGAWLFLTAGIAVGCHWADREAGWGGWWSWDRLAAASLVAWLAATALLHLLPAAARGGPLLRWAPGLALLPLPLAALAGWLGPAVPRAEAFPYAADPASARAFLAVFSGLSGAALATLARRASFRTGDAPFEMISRESALAAGVLASLCALAVVLVGLVHPLAAQALGLARGVGSAYFDAVFVTLAIPALALTGLAPRLAWGSEPARAAGRDAFRPAAAGAASAALGVLFLDRFTAAMATGLFLSAWIAWHVVESLAGRHRRAGDARAPRDVPALQVAHFGVALLVAGITLAGGLEQVTEVAIAPGATEPAGPLLLRVDGARDAEGPNYRAVRLRVVAREGMREILLEPEARIYRAGGLPTRETATHRTVARDLQVSLAGSPEGGAWVLRVRVLPFMSLAWAGLALAAAGGLLALAREVAGARLATGGSRRPGERGLALGGRP